MRWGFIVLLVLSISLAAPTYMAAQDDARYFSETGHWVTGDFLRFYERVSDPVQVYGYPITDAFQTGSVPQHPGMLVQYFQKARLEYHPENRPELQVTISPLGEYAYEKDGPGKVVPTAPLLGRCRNIPADGFPVCYDFLTFFDAYGGIGQFGYPISRVEYHNGRMVQYFQKTRFEWHNELPTGEEVTLTYLGKQYFDLNESPTWLLPNTADYVANVLSLKAHAFIDKAAAAPDDTLTLYVIVEDQNLQAVPGAQVNVVVRFPNGAENRYVLDLTDEHGVTQLSFDLRDAHLGRAEVFVTVTNNLLKTQTRTSFRIW